MEIREKYPVRKVQGTDATIPPYERALTLVQHGQYVYTGRGNAATTDWRYDHAPTCFRDAIDLLEEVRTSAATQLRMKAMYYLYKAFYRDTSRSGTARRELAKAYDICHIEAELTLSDNPRHRAAVWIVEAGAPLEKLGIRLLDLYERLRPAQ